MSLAIGLGGFMDGFQKGMQIKQDRADADRRKTLQDRQDAEYTRVTEQRAAIDDINKEAKSTFDAQVASGTQQPGNFDQFWTDYALPKLKNTYLLNGDVENATRVQEWGDQEDTRKGARLFAGALFKAQTGDASGALTDVMEAAKVKGYMNNGYQVLGHEAIVGQDGSQQGYRISLKTPDGKDVSQDVRTQDLPKLIATFGNPQAAWESQVASRAATDKKRDELETYEAKKKIDRQYGTGENKERGNAITALRKRYEGGLGGDEVKFDDMPRPQQEKLIAQELELQQGQIGLAGGAPPAPEKKVLVDQTTGKPVPSSSAPKAEAKPPAKANASPRAESTQAPIPGVPERAQSGVRSRMEGLQRSANSPAPAPAAPTPASPSDTASLVSQADVAIKNGARVYDVAMGLQESGVPESEWPASLKQAIATQRGVIGLGD